MLTKSVNSINFPCQNNFVNLQHLICTVLLAGNSRFGINLTLPTKHYLLFICSSLIHLCSSHFSNIFFTEIKDMLYIYETQCFGTFSVGISPTDPLWSKQTNRKNVKFTKCAHVVFSNIQIKCYIFLPKEDCFQSLRINRLDEPCETNGWSLLYKFGMVSSFTQFLWSQVPSVHFVERVEGVGGGNKPTQGSLVSEFPLSVFIRWVQPITENDIKL